MITRTFLKSSVLAVLLSIGLGGAAWATDIFLVASYDENDVCGRPQYEAAMDALKQGGFANLSSKGYFLDTRVRPKEQVAKDIEQIKHDIRTQKPRFVFTIDDPAFAMLYQEILQQPETKLVFTGLNRSLDAYNTKAPFLEKRTPSANITGTFEYIFMREQFDMLEAILNKPLKKVAILYSTDSVGLILKDQIIDELKGSQHENSLELFAADDIPTMLAHARTINERDDIDAYIPVTMSVPDPADNTRKTMQAVAPLLTQTIRKIDISLNSSFTEFGFFGGVSIDFYQMGFQSGFQAVKLLKGGRITDAPIEDANRSIIAINRKRMQELGIKLAPETQGIVDTWIN
ncbi:MAG: hypothetical protein GX049_01555 [Alcaligenaceae bacterium]|nr:hypothetical protein [Alcaligenaceae bacterium]